MADSAILCRLWADLAANPDDAAVADSARARLLELVAHVPLCAACGRISDAMPFPEQVFAVLGDEDALREMEALPRHEDESIACAVEYLLGSLPDHVNAPVGAFEPLTIFRAIEAVDRLGAGPHAKQAAVRAIARHAEVSAAEAKSLWDWQQLVAADYCHTLHSSQTDLIARWQVNRPARSRTALLGVLTGFKDAVASLPRTLAGRVTALREDNVERRATPEESLGAIDRASTMPTILSYLRKEERENPGAVTDPPEAKKVQNPAACPSSRKFDPAR